MSENSSERGITRDKSSIRYAAKDGNFEARPWDAAEVLDEVGGDPENYEHKLPELDLPGHGSTQGDCGDEEVPRFCSECGSTHMLGRTCYQSECPRCWRSWARRRAHKVCSKLEGLRAYRTVQQGKSPKFHHLAISPPDDLRFNREDPLEAAWGVLKEVLQHLGADTGFLAYHPYRASQEGSHGDNRGVWKDILPSEGDDLDMEETRELMDDDSGHFHAIVLSHYVSGGDWITQINDRTGWVIKRITQKQNPNVSIYGKFDLARAVTYVISHMGIDTRRGRNKWAGRYFGQLHNFTPVESIEEEMDEVVRSVAPKTLGLKWDSLACLNTKAKWAEGGNVDPQAAEASRSSGSTSSSSGTSSDSSTSTADGGAVVEIETEDACKGRLLDIGKAPRYLDDPEWRAEASHVDELQQTWDEWRDRIDSAPAD